MKRILSLAACFLFASISSSRAVTSFGPFSYGQRWGTQQLDFYSIFAGDERHVFTIDSEQNTTGLEFPHFQSTYPFEPGSGGRAFEFVVNGEGSGGDPWQFTQNSIFTWENGVGGPETISNIEGDVGPLIFNANCNIMLWNKWDNFSPVDGDFDYGLVNSGVAIEMTDVVYSYLIDGADGADNFFTVTVSDGTNSSSIDFTCSAPVLLTRAQLTTPTIVQFSNFNTVTVSFSNTGNCAVVPTFRSLQLHFAFTTTG